MIEENMLYAVALTFSGDIHEKLSKLREEYQQYMNSTIAPHVTLVYPFVLSTDMSNVIKKLTEAAKKTRPFTLILNGVAYFEGENNVAYVAIKNEQPVKNLHVVLEKSLEGLIVEYYADPHNDLGEFIPHMTIGEKIPAEILPGVKKKFSNYKIYHKCEIADFSLFSEDNGVWSKDRVFKLRG